MSNDGLLTGKILKLHNWPDGKIIGIAKRIGAQHNLVDVIGKFMPRIVRMADESGDY